jgi:hypothetical protein
LSLQKIFITNYGINNEETKFKVRIPRSAFRYYLGWPSYAAGKQADVSAIQMDRTLCIFA